MGVGSESGNACDYYHSSVIARAGGIIILTHGSVSRFELIMKV